ncbi:MAG: peptidoglycan-associated lipoprotein Pal [Duodenibacillus sp.]
MRNFHKAALTALAGAVLLLAGCSSVQLDESAKQGTSAAEAMARAQAQPASPFKPDSVYFDFDSYTVKPEYIPVIERHARALIATPAQAVQVQGNTDSRGSREYNLALGQKRSEAVKQRLQLFGVPASRIEAVSFGSEKPVANGENEEAWALNRRADVVAP